MIQPLNYHDIMKMAAMCGLSEPITIVDTRSGRVYEQCVIDTDPVTEQAFVYTEDGAYFVYDYGMTWWGYNIMVTKLDIPNWDI